MNELPLKKSGNQYIPAEQLWQICHVNRDVFKEKVKEIEQDGRTIKQKYGFLGGK